MTTREPSEGGAIAPNGDDSTASATPAHAGKLVGRSQAARLLGVSKSTVRRMEGQGLTPVVGPNNTHLFHEEQVQSLIVTRRSETGSPSRVTGDIAADAFRLLDEGLHPVDVVKRLRLEPDLVEALHLNWSRMRGQLVLSADGITSLHRLICGDEGEKRPGTESDLVAIVQKWINVSVRATAS